MAVFKIILALTIVCAFTNAQRPFYAGFRPIGFPETPSNSLLNRFGETQGPIELRGDGNLANRFQQMPVDNRPFWYLNWRQYDALRRNPQTYPQTPNVFLPNNL